MKEESIIDLLLNPNASFLFVGTPDRKNELQDMIQQWRESGINQLSDQGVEYEK